MGGSDEPYIWHFPVAVVRVGNRVLAFATLCPTTASSGVLLIDLMLYADDAPKDVMDFSVRRTAELGPRAGPCGV